MTKVIARPSAPSLRPSLAAAMRLRAGQSRPASRRPPPRRPSSCRCSSPSPLLASRHNSLPSTAGKLTVARGGQVVETGGECEREREGLRRLGRRRCGGRRRARARALAGTAPAAWEAEPRGRRRARARMASAARGGGAMATGGESGRARLRRHGEEGRVQTSEHKGGEHQLINREDLGGKGTGEEKQLFDSVLSSVKQGTVFASPAGLNTPDTGSLSNATNVRLISPSVFEDSGADDYNNHVMFPNADAYIDPPSGETQTMFSCEKLRKIRIYYCPPSDKRAQIIVRILLANLCPLPEIKIKPIEHKDGKWLKLPICAYGILIEITSLMFTVESAIMLHGS
ncbi:hypothetical protein PR202_ga22174 [Eleusine coracana subsp. coracana]|uniref:Uncharacterized protein n=1 Tax=Eleusine coracana subsp. coracana TaxID=191504 RepID=A0AAV5D2V5_ELECO|nr:hypothetical protein PR202_ga22174 [Eleusine coracana subsp. coracana]